MTEGEAECAVQRFSEANFSRISNKSGFFMGIIRRVKEDGPDKGSGDLDILPRPVRYRLRDLLDDVSAVTSAGSLQPGHADSIQLVASMNQLGLR